MTKTLIIGASSGIGEALARELDLQGHKLALTGRRVEMIQKNTSLFNIEPIIRFMDLSNVDDSIICLNEIIEKMGGLDLIIINAGVGMPNRTFEEEMNIVDINVKGFTAMARSAYNYFRQQGGGHIAGVSSVVGGRGMRISSAYAASKAYMSFYMEGLRHHAFKRSTNISITDIRPGFVLTPLTEEKEKMFWVATPEKAAKQIRRAINRKAKIAYITNRYFLVYWLLKLLPEWVYYRF